MANILPLDSLTTRRECALKLLEEASEACEAIKKHDKTCEWFTYQDALLELVDVAQCMCNCLHELGVKRDEWENAVRRVRENNEKRSRRPLPSSNVLTIEWRSRE